MSILTYPLGFIGGGKEFYNGVMENSLRFNFVGMSGLVSTTTMAESNKTTCTNSVWLKRGNAGRGHTTAIMGSAASSGTGPGGFLTYNSTDKIWFQMQSGTGAFYNELWRDPSAWYHVVFVFDTYNEAATDRARLFVNGKRITPSTAISSYSLGEITSWFGASGTATQAVIGIYGSEGVSYSASG